VRKKKGGWLILTDREIRNSLEAGLFDITPRPALDAYSSTTVDLTLSPILRVFRKEETPGLNQTIDPSAPGFKAIELVRKLTDRADIDPEKGFTLQRDVLLLGWSAETVDLKDHCRVAARVEGKSSLARVGLAIHVTAPIIHTGFKAPIQLEMINHGPLPICLRIGMKICQLVFEQTLGMPDKAYKGQFLGQSPS
jgi:dCTP deaminase